MEDFHDKKALIVDLSSAASFRPGGKLFDGNGIDVDIALKPEPYDPQRCRHDLLSLLRQNLYGLALGYEDLNDHDTLHDNQALQTSVNRTAGVVEFIDPVPV